MVDVAYTTDDHEFRENDDYARRFGLMRPQTRERRIAPVGETDDFACFGFLFRRADWLEHLETAAIEKERMVPEQVVQLRDRRMVVGKNLRIELVQGLLHLGRI